MNELLATCKVKFRNVYDTSVEEITEDEGEEVEKEQNLCDIETDVESLAKEKVTVQYAGNMASSDSFLGTVSQTRPTVTVVELFKSSTVIF